MDGMIAVFAIVAVFVICWYILNVVAYWRIFTKAGEAGWKSLIPVYNTYVQYKLTWNTKMFFVSLALSLITGSLSMIGGSAENLSYVDLPDSRRDPADRPLQARRGIWTRSPVRCRSGILKPDLPADPWIQRQPVPGGTLSEYFYLLCRRNYLF